MQDQLIERCFRRRQRGFLRIRTYRLSIDQLKTPRGFATALIEMCIALFLLSMVLGGLGGALGSAILGAVANPKFSDAFRRKSVALAVAAAARV